MEVSSPEELIEILKKLEAEEAVTSMLPSAPPTEIPKISDNIGPSDAIREVLSSSWGKAEPRTMKEIMEILKANAVYFSESSLSGILTRMTKKGELRRPIKKEGKWAYILTG